MQSLSPNRLLLISMLALAALLLLTLNVAPAANAADQVVSDCGDNGGLNQLRAKLAAAQSSGGGTLTFTCGPTILLDPALGALPTITTTTTVDGGGTIAISGNNGTRIFNVNAGATLTLNSIEIAHASATGDGGAIVNHGTLNINGSKFLNNQASSGFSGGAIESFGVMHIANSEFANNSAGNGAALFPRESTSFTSISGSSFHDNFTTNTTNGWGGALLVWNGAQMNIGSTGFISNTAQRGGAAFVTSASAITLTDNVTLSGNQATYGFGGSGGGIYNEGTANLTNVTLSGNPGVHGAGIYNSGTANLTNVTLSGNVASGSGGGGIWNQSGALNLTGVTLSGNQSPAGSGAGIKDSGGTLNLTNVTLSGNVASTVGGTGGGIVIDGATARLTNVSLSGNSATQVGGIYIGTANVTLTNTLIVKGANGVNCSTFLIGSFNLSDDGSCGFGTGRDNVTTLNLGPLADNGGFTQTHLPGAGSAAIDDGGGCPPPATDQRGVARPQGLACDVGSVEVVVLRYLWLPLIRR